MAPSSIPSIVRLLFRIMTLSSLFYMALSSQHSLQNDVKSLIYSLQNKYCGRQLCNSDPSQQPPLCTEDTVQFISEDQGNNLTMSMPASTKRQEHPPCSECSCTDSCALYGNCCANKHIGGEYFFDCQEISRHIPNGIQSIYSYVVTRCLPDAPKYSKELAEKCEHGTLGYIQDGRLITAPHRYNTSVTFRNKYCAMCYDVTNYTPWDVYVSCGEDYDFSNYTDINSLIRSASESRDCHITTDHQDASQSPICQRYHGMISTCNVTGTWQEYNETMETACHSYLNPTLNYRNIFCALCNGISKENLMCPSGDFILPYIPSLFAPFSAILNFDNSDVEVLNARSQSYPIRRIGVQKKNQCRDGDVFDSNSGKCREKYCPLARALDNETCVDLVPTENYVLTTWNVTVYYTDDIVIPYGGFLSAIGGSVINGLEHMLMKLGFALSDASPKDFASIHSTNDLIIKESQIEFKLFLLPDSSLELSRHQLQDMTNFTMNITWDEQTIGLQIIHDANPRNITDMLSLSTMMHKYAPVWSHDIDLSKTIDVPLTFNVSCPMVRFESQEISKMDNSIIIHGDTVVGEDEYFLMNTNDYFICVNAMLQLTKLETPTTTLTTDTAERLTSVEYQIEQIITVVSFSCSFIFLMITMLVYIFIKQLHTVPGLNLIFLTSSLFLAQALYFFGAGTVSVTTPTVCTVIGVLIHYFWLVAFAWMNVCCLHMFRVFSNLFNSLDFADDKKGVLLKYVAFAYGVPLIIVGITISVSYLLSNNTSLGYGGPTLCFVASGLVSTLSFGVPAGVTVLTNTVLLIYTVVSLHRAKSGHSRNGKAGTSDIAKFFKLSTITGLSWLFGFLGYFLKRVELLYVFTILTAGQGVFIFLSFVLSTRILKLVKERFVCSRAKRGGMERYYDNTSSRGQTMSESISSRHGNTGPM